jgi:hypothetical protein
VPAMTDDAWSPRPVSMVARDVQRGLVSPCSERQRKPPQGEGREVGEAPGRPHQRCERASAVDHPRRREMDGHAQTVVRGGQIRSPEAALAHPDLSGLRDDEGPVTEVRRKRFTRGHPPTLSEPQPPWRRPGAACGTLPRSVPQWRDHGGKSRGPESTSRRSGRSFRGLSRRGWRGRVIGDGMAAPWGRCSPVRRRGTGGSRLRPRGSGRAPRRPRRRRRRGGAPCAP